MAELRTHDELLERAVDRAYLDLDRYYARPSLFRAPVRLAHSLREERIDLARMADEILNLSKYFGDWYLARIYQGLSNRFHLAEWEAQLERKLRTVDSLYGLIASEMSDRKMIVLEFAIVLLFILDIVFFAVVGG
jgi:hypothetical protein